MMPVAANPGAGRRFQTKTSSTTTEPARSPSIAEIRSHSSRLAPSGSLLRQSRSSPATPGRRPCQPVMRQVMVRLTPSTA